MVVIISLVYILDFIFVILLRSAILFYFSFSSSEKSIETTIPHSLWNSTSKTALSEQIVTGITEDVDESDKTDGRGVLVENTRIESTVTSQSLQTLSRQTSSFLPSKFMFSTSTDWICVSPRFVFILILVLLVFWFV